MRRLFLKREETRDQFAGKHVFLFLDYDGVLALIAMAPDKAVLPEKTRVLLKELAREPDCKVAVVSGRSLADLKEKLGLNGIIYSGNHGLEIEGPRVRVARRVSQGYKSALKRMKSALDKKLSCVKGVIVENKGLSLSLHYRMADKKSVSLIRAAFRDTAASYLSDGRIDILCGKKVFEVRPVLEWNKGKAVMWLLKRYGPLLKGKKVLAVYIGDDATDEDAFKALKSKGLTVYVGVPRRSYARYYLKNTVEVAELLRMILESTRGKRAC